MACHCCGAAGSLRRCVVCAQLCDGVHGEKLQVKVSRLVAFGRISPYHAIAAMMIDDALLAGLLEFVPGEPGQGATIAVPAVPRWRVVAARALASGEMVAIGDVLQAAIGRHMGRANVPRVREELRRDLLEALTFIDRDIVDIEIDVDRDSLDPENLRIIVKKTINCEPGAVHVSSPDVEIPADILTRARAKA